jgi:hypothetical protein
MELLLLVDVVVFWEICYRKIIRYYYYIRSSRHIVQESPGNEVKDLLFFLKELVYIPNKLFINPQGDFEAL